MVLQDTWLFEGTVRENLKYNTPDVTDDAMKAAARACGIHSFIKALPQGYDTVLNDNTAISAGQKQLMTIARAMIQNSPMLILDEATSSVDTRTELMTQKAMDALMKERTSFVIRPSSLHHPQRRYDPGASRRGHCRAGRSRFPDGPAGRLR